MSPRVTLGVTKSCRSHSTVSSEQPMPSVSHCIPLHPAASLSIPLHLSASRGIPPHPSASRCIPPHPLSKSSDPSWGHRGDTFMSMSQHTCPPCWLCTASQTEGCLFLTPDHHPALWPRWAALGRTPGLWNSSGAAKPLSEPPACNTTCATSF